MNEWVNQFIYYNINIFEMTYKDVLGSKTQLFPLFLSELTF